ncbi:MAG: heme o synthase [Candidatus Saccharimonadales bacterium]
MAQKKVSFHNNSLATGMRAYYRLAKPGIIYGNILTVIGGFLLAAHGRLQMVALIAVIFGSALIIGCGCVLNNLLDQDIDRLMQRTRQRALVTGQIPQRHAVTYAAVLGVGGFAILSGFTNQTTVIVGLIGLISYVIVYGYAKRHTVHGTLIGSIAGSVPIVAGYTAARGHIDGGGALLALILAAWQMAHFYGIALYRSEDYKAAHIPVMPLIKGVKTTERQIIIYIILFIISCSLLTIFDYAGYTFLIVMSGLGVTWLVRSVRSRSSLTPAVWGRQVFFFSLIVILGLSVMLSVGSVAI